VTDAQFKALTILGDADRPVGAWRRRSMALGEPMTGASFEGQPNPIARVNIKAVGWLCRQRFAARQLSFRASVFTHDDTYTITNAGREALTAEQRRRGLLEVQGPVS
jgi:hypothetical protein